MTSFPPPPTIVSWPVEPRITSFPVVPWRVSVAFVPRIVTSCPLQVPSEPVKGIVNSCVCGLRWPRVSAPFTAGSFSSHVIRPRLMSLS
jgi:hypothetical protein